MEEIIEVVSLETLEVAIEGRIEVIRGALTSLVQGKGLR